MLVNLAAICVFERARFKDADWSERVEKEMGAFTCYLFFSSVSSISSILRLYSSTTYF
jgi:hypothetical protein